MIYPPNFGDGDFFRTKLDPFDGDSNQMSKKPKNNLPVKEITNNNKGLTLIEQESGDIAPGEPLSREDRFIIELYENGGSMREAGIAAGYSKSYASSIICRKFRSERFLRKLRDYNYSEYHKLLPKLRRIDMKALEHVDGDITQLPKFERTIGTIKRQIGVLADDQPGPVNVVNIGQIQAFVKANHEAKMAGTATPAIIDVKPESNLIEE